MKGKINNWDERKIDKNKNKKGHEVQILKQTKMVEAQMISLDEMMCLKKQILFNYFNLVSFFFSQKGRNIL